jgi:hypothetical protein
LDVNALLSYDAKNILKELMSSRSDNIQLKRQMIRDLRETGTTFMESWDSSSTGESSKLFKIYMISAGLFADI